MKVADIIAIIAIVLVIGAAVAYIIRAKRSGKKCIGCPDGASCGKGGSGCSCGCGNAGESVTSASGCEGCTMCGSENKNQ